MADPNEYWPPQTTTAETYRRLVKHVQQSGEHAILHGSSDPDHFCMDFDCETWGSDGS